MCCKNSSIHLYAEDDKFYLSRPFGLTEYLSFRLNDDLESIYKCSEDNKLLINIAKTQAICLLHKGTRMDIPTLKRNNTAITTYTHQVKYLGFIINSKFDCVSHFNATMQKIYLVCRKLWYIASFLHDNVKLRLVKIYIIPFMVQCLWSR